jgi:RNA polymerase sigma-70 factor (ECF subfamily)
MKGPDHSSSREAASSPAGSTSASLLDQVKQGDAAGWQRLMAVYRPLVLWWCRRWLPRHDDAEDVAQDVFLTAFTRISADGFDRQRQGSFRTWLRGITRRKLMEHGKRARKQPSAAGGSDAREALDQCPDRAIDEVPAEEDASELRILLRSALEVVRADFTASTWEATMRTIDGQPPAGVAADLGLTTAAVYTARSRVLARLRKEMANLLD